MTMQNRNKIFLMFDSATFFVVIVLIIITIIFFFSDLQFFYSISKQNLKKHHRNVPGTEELFLCGSYSLN